MEARYLENDTGRPAIVTNFKDGTPSGMVHLNDFVFGTNPRYFALYLMIQKVLLKMVIYTPYRVLKHYIYPICVTIVEVLLYIFPILAEVAED